MWPVLFFSLANSKFHYLHFLLRTNKRKNTVNLKYTACLASLLMACPIAVPAAFAETGWVQFDSFRWDYGFITSSGHAESLNNHVTNLPDSLPEGSLEKGFVVGCAKSKTYKKGNNEASNNSFTYNGGKFWFISVGNAGIDPRVDINYVDGKDSKAEKNKIILTNAEVKGSVICGGAWGDETATSNDNRIELNGGTYGEKFSTRYSLLNSIGCKVDGSGSTLLTIQATNNRIILKGGIYNVGFVSTCMFNATTAKLLTVANNAVELYADKDGNSPKFYEMTVISPLAGTLYTPDRDGYTVEGNSLNLNDVKNMTAGNIAYFQELKFEYSKMLAGDVILTLTGTESDKLEIKKRTTDFHRRCQSDSQRQKSLWRGRKKRIQDRGQGCSFEEYKRHCYGWYRNVSLHHCYHGYISFLCGGHKDERGQHGTHSDSHRHQFG